MDRAKPVGLPNKSNEPINAGERHITSAIYEANISLPIIAGLLTT